jgi:hypothetical protein
MRSEHCGDEILTAFLDAIPDRRRCAVFSEASRNEMIVSGEHRRGYMNSCH